MLFSLHGKKSFNEIKIQNHSCLQEKSELLKTLNHILSLSSIVISCEGKRKIYL